jgi:vacuolar-type H+-ATPase subunit E/Vma4
MTLCSRQEAALEPVRAALLRQAEDRAAAIVQRAQDEASARLERARKDAADLIATSAADGRAQASQVMQAQLGLRRREAREQLLNSDLTSYQDLTDRVRSAVLALRSDAGYPRLRARLADIASRAACAGATVTEPADGGAVATAP